MTRAYVAESELQRIADHCAEHRRRETGGSLFGYFTHSGAPVVLLATGPGPRARHAYAEFHQDPTYLEACAGVLFGRFGLQHIGEWHSHHELGLAEPSGGDVETVRKGMAAHGWRSFVVVIAHFPDPRRERLVVEAGFFLLRPDTWELEECAVEVLPGESPIQAARPELPATGKRPVARPPTPYRLRAPVGPTAVDAKRWYARSPARERIARELKAFDLLRREAGFTASMTPDGNDLRVDLSGPAHSSVWRLFPGFPATPPLVELTGRPLARGELAWDPSRLIAQQALELRPRSARTPRLALREHARRMAVATLERLRRLLSALADVSNGRLRRQ